VRALIIKGKRLGEIRRDLENELHRLQTGGKVIDDIREAMKDVKCSFYKKGECKYGEDCFAIHDNPAKMDRNRTKSRGREYNEEDDEPRREQRPKSIIRKRDGERTRSRSRVRYSITEVEEVKDEQRQREVKRNEDASREEERRWRNDERGNQNERYENQGQYSRHRREPSASPGRWNRLERGRNPERRPLITERRDEIRDSTKRPWEYKESRGSRR
jgi:hypothetical protein